ncbi:6436_t:CDS:2 [Acaulospora morrowiae]|uniref:6436_t:CDS:1 n=1 Tax=Acaulospora morrowiae TaxID=94023 RepID=A0A9N8V9Z3_9GLOM|nr:6436_t:CDS:2 [Acaulospora morrowiae]
MPPVKPNRHNTHNDSFTHHISRQIFTRRSDFPQHFTTISEARNAEAICKFDWITEFKIKELIDYSDGLLEISILPSFFFETYNLAFPQNNSKDSLGDVLKSTYPETFETMKFEDREYIFSILSLTVNNTTSQSGSNLNINNINTLLYDCNYRSRYYSSHRYCDEIDSDVTSMDLDSDENGSWTEEVECSGFSGKVVSSEKKNNGLHETHRWFILLVNGFV